MDTSARIYARVDLDRMDENIRIIEGLQSKPTPIMAVIKANGYGHGSVAIAKALERNDHVCGYAVATAEEAIQLRDFGIKKMILVLGYVFPRDYARMIDKEIRFCLFRYDTAKGISDMAKLLGKDAYIHIKLDTGMGRIGFVAGEQSISEITEIASMERLNIEGIFTHFARADEADKTAAHVQLDLFNEIVTQLEAKGLDIPMKHCANSATLCSMPECGMNMIRAGVVLYGMCPSQEVGPNLGLKPVLSLHSNIIHIKTIKAGDTVSYGGTYVAEGERVIATLPVGYADGYPRSLSNKGEVLVRGKRAPIVGRICMDQLMIDVTDIPDVQMLDLVTLIGEDGDEAITMEELGQLSGRFNYEFACDLGIRIPRFYFFNGREIGKWDFFA